MQRFRELWQNMSTRSKRVLAGVSAATLIAILAAFFFLVRGRDTSYQTLFTGLSQEEAKQVVGLLQDDGVEYTYDGTKGAVRVPGEQADALRAELLSKGYPKSGFTYDMYLKNSGLMTTESDKQQYTLYDLQDRLGATVRLFDGVRDAKVTIAEGSKQTYVIEENETKDASASVVVTMKDGETLSEKNAAAIKNLVARSVKGMNFTNVSVFDAATMQEISADSDVEGGSGASLAALTSQVEDRIAANIRRVLAKLYGMENVEVSVKGTLDMSRLVQESTTYNVPDKRNEEDKTGLLYHEELSGENASGSRENASGVVGADANADTPRYTNNDSSQTTADGYSNSSAARDWFYNVIKEQRELPPGVLQELSVAVVIQTEDNSIPVSELQNLVADAAGITRADAADRITVLRAPDMMKGGQTENTPENTADAGSMPVPAFPLWALIGAAVSFLLLVILLIILLLRRRKRRKAALSLSDEELESSESLSMGLSAPLPDEPSEEGELDMPEMAQSQSHIERGMKLKKNIGEFVDQNPQVVAKLIQSMLREEGERNGGK